MGAMFRSTAAGGRFLPTRLEYFLFKDRSILRFLVSSDFDKTGSGERVQEERVSSGKSVGRLCSRSFSCFGRVIIY